MNDIQSQIQQDPSLIKVLGWYAIIGCAIFAISILIADWVVPDHDWIADTISDLGAGKYEFILDIGIYAFSASVISTALLASHIHLGGVRWSIAIAGLALLGLIVFLVGARNEYGDDDNDGVVIHVYLVYGLGFLMTAIPLLLAKGAGRIAQGFTQALIAIAIVWSISAPIFFFLPTGWDGIYERYLGLIAFVLICTLSKMFMQTAKHLNTK